MNEILHLLFNPLPNGIMSILMGFSLVYWFFQLLAGDGIDLGTENEIHFGDIHDVDAHTETDFDQNIDKTVEPSFFSKILDFIHVGKVPLMVLVTVFKFISWVITIVSTTAFGLAQFGIWSVVILIPIFILVFIAMHWISKPLVKLFSELGYHGEEEMDFIGRIGTLKSTVEDQKLGSGEFKINQDIYTLNIISQTGEKINFGEHIIIIDEDKSQNIYYVTKHLTLHNL